jgi:hypothetical protein
MNPPAIQATATESLKKIVRGLRELMIRDCRLVPEKTTICESIGTSSAASSPRKYPPCGSKSRTDLTSRESAVQPRNLVRSRLAVADGRMTGLDDRIGQLRRRQSGCGPCEHGQHRDDVTHVVSGFLGRRLVRQSATRDGGSARREGGSRTVTVTHVVSGFSRTVIDPHE